MRMRPLAAAAVLLSLLAACGGPRVVNDEWAPGVPKRQGQTVAGKQQGEWRYFYSDGARQAAGAWAGDFQDGTWRWWYANGQLQQEGTYRAHTADGRLLDGRRHSAGIREGLWRFWNEDGTLASEGRYVDDRQEGAWAYYGKGAGSAAKRFGALAEAPSPLPTGPRFASGTFTAGVKDQAWTWWHPGGTQQRQAGSFRLGLKVGAWTTWNPDGTVKLREEYTQPGVPAVAKAEPPPTPRPAPVAAPEPAAPVAAPEPVARPAEPVPAPPVVVKAAEPELTIPPADEPALSPSPVQPAVWTTGQEANAAALVRRYTTGETALMVGYDDGSFGGTSTDDRQKRDLLGKPLPATRFLAADGRVVDLKERSAKRPAVLVFLRGFSGQVCLYCAAQTSALSNAMPRFSDQGIDVFLVYPGPVDAVPAFIQAVKSLRKEPPPMPVFLDVSLLAVRALGIEDNLAKPTSVIIDPSGQVRWAYVGKTIADRPSVSDLLREAAKYVK
jgi:antitoxin component YwqK of YwqJK toxin-antitoxin module/peroxiredoxin